MSKHLLILLCGLLVGVGCGTPEAPFDESPKPLDNPSFTRQWGTTLGHAKEEPINEIYLSDQFVFAYRQGGISAVMDRATGRLLHVDHPKDGYLRLHPPVVLNKERIVYPTTTYLEVFDVSGRYIEHATKPTDELDKPFSQRLDYPIRSDVVGLGKLVFFGADYAGGGRAIEVDMTRPYVPAVWTLMQPGASITAAPALLKDVVYVAADNGKVAAVATDSREPIWALEQGVFGTYGRVDANLAVDQTGVYVASTDTKLYCLQRTGGRVKWQYFAGAPLHHGVTLTKDMVYLPVPGVGLVAIDKNATSQGTDRTARWVAADATQFLSEDDHYTYVRTKQNQIAALDKATGQQKFVSKRPDLVAFGENDKGDGIIYVATRTGRVIAARPVLEPGQIGEVVLAPVTPETVAVAR